MKRTLALLALIVAVLVPSVARAQQNTLRIFPHEGTVVCSPRLLRFIPNQNPYAAYYFLYAQQATTLRSFRLTITSAEAPPPHVTAILYVNQVMRAEVPILHEKEGTYSATFSGLSAPIVGDGNNLLIYLTNPLDPMSAMKSFGSKARFSIEEAADLQLDSGTFITPFPVFLGSAMVSPGELEVTFAPVQETYRPRVASDLVGTVRLRTRFLVDSQSTVRLSKIRIWTEAPRMPQVWLTDLQGNVVARTPKRNIGQTAVMTFINSPTLTSTSDVRLRLYVNALQLENGPFYLDFTGDRVDYTFSSPALGDFRFTAEPCSGYRYADLYYY